MKKYWSTLLALIVIVASIGTFYVSSIIEAKSYPEFDIQSLEGDESVLHPIGIVAHYEDDTKDGVIQMAHDTMVYRDHQSFFEQLKGHPFTYERRLREEYSSIYRKATHLGNNVYENDQYIVVVKLVGDRYERQYDALEVDVFDKEADEMETLTADLDKLDVWIQDIQMNDEEIIVLASAWIDNGQHGRQESFLSYHFNISNGQFEVKAIDYFNETDPAVSISTLSDTPSWKPIEFVVFRKENEADQASPNEQVNEGTNEVAAEPFTNGELVVYEVETGDIKELALPERFQSKHVNWHDGSNLYFADYQSDAVHMTVFNIRTEKILSEFSIPNGPREGDSPVISVYEGYVYALDANTNQDHNATLIVLDSKTGQSVFHGEIVPKGDKHLGDSFDLYFSGLYFRY